MCDLPLIVAPCDLHISHWELLQPVASSLVIIQRFVTSARKRVTVRRKTFLNALQKRIEKAAHALKCCIVQCSLFNVHLYLYLQKKIGKLKNWSVLLLSNLVPLPVTKSLVFLPIVSLGTTFVSIFSRGKYCSLMLCTLTGTSRDVGASQNMTFFVVGYVGCCLTYSWSSILVGYFASFILKIHRWKIISFTLEVGEK